MEKKNHIVVGENNHLVTEPFFPRSFYSWVDQITSTQQFLNFLKPYITEHYSINTVVFQFFELPNIRSFRSKTPQSSINFTPTSLKIWKIRIPVMYLQKLSFVSF